MSMMSPRNDINKDVFVTNLRGRDGELFNLRPSTDYKFLVKKMTLIVTRDNNHMAVFIIGAAVVVAEAERAAAKQREMDELDGLIQRKRAHHRLQRATLSRNRRTREILSVVFHFDDKSIIEHRSQHHHCRAHYRRVLERYGLFDERLRRQYYEGRDAGCVLF
jgi:hypothetical protein